MSLYVQTYLAIKLILTLTLTLKIQGTIHNRSRAHARSNKRTHRPNKPELNRQEPTLSHVSLKYSSWAPSVSFLGDRYFRTYHLIVSMATRQACHVTQHTQPHSSVWHVDRFYFVFIFLSTYSQTSSLYYEISYIPILKYVQVNVFGSLNTFIMTVLVDLYQLMGAAMLVCAES